MYCFDERSTILKIVQIYYGCNSRRIGVWQKLHQLAGKAADKCYFIVLLSLFKHAITIIQEKISIVKSITKAY